MPRYTPTAKQWEALSSKKARIAFLGGLGSGKTDCGSLWIIMKLRGVHPGFPGKPMIKGQMGLIAANSYSQLKDATLTNFYKNMDLWGIELDPPEVPRGNSPITIRVNMGTFWFKILARSLDNFSVLAGTQFCFAWIDEVFQTSTEAINMVTQRLRDDSHNPKMPIQALFTSTLSDVGGTLHKMCVADYDPDIIDVIYSPTSDNEHNLPITYIPLLRSTLTEKEFQRQVLAEWVNLEGSEIYTSFSDVNESILADYDPFVVGGFVGWGHDFNIGVGKPMSSVLFQVVPIYDDYGKLLYDKVNIFYEFILKSSDTYDAILAYNRSEWPMRLEKPPIIFGDASGSSKSSSSKTTDYGILRDAGFIVQRVPKKNPPIRTRHNIVNSRFRNADGLSRCFIHPRCVVALEGFRTVRLRPDKYDEVETYHQHVTTAVGYALCELFPVARFLGKFKLRGL